MSRLEQIQHIIQDPNFKYQKESCPDILTDTLTQSSYWMHTELFDESYLYKKENQFLSSSQKIHLKMVDIGVMLLNKGFPLEYEPKNFSQIGSNQLATYVKTFVEQCHKRHAFLKGQKTKRIFPIQKVRD